VITSISYDHMAVLGDTLGQIATEKAGIIKPGLPVVLSPQSEQARQAITHIAAQQKAPISQVGQDYVFEPSHNLWMVKPLKFGPRPPPRKLFT